MISNHLKNSNELLSSHLQSYSQNKVEATSHSSCHKTIETNLTWYNILLALRIYLSQAKPTKQEKLSG